jgi:hypothetical protein
MDYDTERNALFSLGPVPPFVTHQELIIQVKDEDNLTQEEFILKILPAAQNTLVQGEDELEKPESKVKAKVEIIEDEEASESTQLQSTGTASTTVPVSKNSSGWFNRGAKAQGHVPRMPQPPVEEVELETMRSGYEASL